MLPERFLRESSEEDVIETRFRYTLFPVSLFSWRKYAPEAVTAIDETLKGQRDEAAIVSRCDGMPGIVLAARITSEGEIALMSNIEVEGEASPDVVHVRPMAGNQIVSTIEKDVSISLETKVHIERGGYGPMELALSYLGSMTFKTALAFTQLTQQSHQVGSHESRQEEGAGSPSSG